MSHKIPKIFECNCCNYNTSNKKDYSRHLLTRKHTLSTERQHFSPKKTLTFSCDICNKVYKERTGLWKHKQKCSGKANHQPTHEYSAKEPIKMPEPEVFIELLKQNQEFKQLMIEQSKQIQEQQTENQELQKQLIEAVKVSGPHIENQTNINNNNQKFNLNFFLNEQCKDAINMSDFIENMELDIEDLTETGRLGYVGGISRILINKLQELDIYKRPLHCTDMKRETLYIKENDEWEKQANPKDKMGCIINKVANKNCRKLPEWTEKHPDYQVFDSLDNMEYMRLTQIVLGGLGEQECNQFKDKIIRGVIKEVMVHK